jgi:hypothetical protein
MNTKTCYKCKQELPISQFRCNKSRKDGLQVYCKDCDKLKQSEWYQKNKVSCINKSKICRKRKRDWWHDFKSQLKCNRCDENHPACLHFHHINPSEKEADLSQVVLVWSKKRIITEVNKCEVLCANCHAKEHYTRYDE